MKAELNNHCKLLLQAVCAVAHVSGYRAQDLRITARLDEAEAAKPGKHNGILRFEVVSTQSYGEFEAPATISAAGQVVTNSYFLSQLPDSSDEHPWVIEEVGNKLHAKLGKTVYDFDIGEASLFQYEPSFCPTNIDISGFAAKIGSFSDVLKLFVNRKKDGVGNATGSVRITGEGSAITFEATDMRNALYGKVPLEATIGEPWRLLVQQQHFASWNNLPHNAFPLQLGVDASSQLTVRCGPVIVQHNTLTNLVDSMNDVSQLAGMFHQFSEPGTDLSDVQFAMTYQPQALNQKVADSTLYCDGDPTILIDSESPDGGLNLIVRSVTVDSNLELESTKLKIEKAGRTSINKNSLFMVNNVARLSTINVDPEKHDTWMIMRVFNSAIMVSSPDGLWVAMTAETSI